MQNMNPKQKLKSTSLLSQSDSETRNSFSIDSARAIARTLIGGGGGVYSYIRVLPD